MGVTGDVFGIPIDVGVDGGVVDAGGGHPDQYLSGTGSRYWNIGPVLKLIEALVTLQQNGAHGF